MAPPLKSLRDSADLRHLRQIIAGLDEGVILVDPDQDILWANTAAAPPHGRSFARQTGSIVAAGPVTASGKGLIEIPRVPR
ncbi:PAS domain-containing protein [Sphingomonas sp. HMP9]|uniref:PAS domain-containing protein n=1 Tax=Sphingomonas sp. HMP9 TaxID=1517554 RepID=UPI001596EDD0|nr:PAS domain-containing protein [Sphingomonas sp. HMP9]